MCGEGRAGDASSHPSAYKNSVTKFLDGFLGCGSASKADLSTQVLAAGCEGRAEWKITFMVRGSGLEPQSLVVSLLCFSSSSRHNSDFAVSVGLD